MYVHILCSTQLHPLSMQPSSSEHMDFIFTPSIVQTTADSGDITVKYAFNGSAIIHNRPTIVNICAAFSPMNVSIVWMYMCSEVIVCYL